MLQGSSGDASGPFGGALYASVSVYFTVKESSFASDGSRLMTEPTGHSVSLDGTAMPASPPGSPGQFALDRG
jgi:hypothetical protein